MPIEQQEIKIEHVDKKQMGIYHNEQKNLFVTSRVCAVVSSKLCTSTTNEQRASFLCSVCDQIYNGGVGLGAPSTIHTLFCREK